MKLIENQTFPLERALYGENGITLRHCSVDGPEDGESALKEAKNVVLEDCYMNLRYPLWHDEGVRIVRSEMTDKCRAALWYTTDVEVEDSLLGGIKALRECARISLKDTRVVSPEFGWRSRDIRVENCDITGEYPFLMASDLHFKSLHLKGKYSFQYVENAVIEDSVLDTKDAFWHTKNMTIRNSVVKGEYLAWYSDHLTLDHCKIIGTQPLCYCTNLTLIDCETEDCDLSFEYSDVEATVKGEILSVKNPRSGHITADRIGELIVTDDSVYPVECVVKTTEEKA